MKKRLIFLFVSLILLLGALMVRLVYIQIIDSEKYAAVTVRQQRISLEGADERGTIYDRNMTPITGIADDYIYIIAKDRMTPDTAKIFNSINAKRVTNTSKRYFVYRGKIFNNDAAYVLKRDYNVFIVKSARRYSEDQAAVHLIGYINESDGNGACGLERDFNDILAKKQKEVFAAADGKRMIIPGLGISSTVENPDCGIVTTLELKLQKKAEEILNASGHSGSIIVADAKTGEILASASSPAYNPYNIKEYLDSSNRELINKAVQSEYPPGSIFKIIVAAAALEKGVVTPDTTFTCNGFIEINGVKIKCSKTEGHGTITFREAFAKSCNSAFIQTALLTGDQAILEMAENFGLGKKRLPDISGEKPGLLPDISDVQGAGIGNLAIGQGKLLVTPIQAAGVTAIIASGGMDQSFSLIRSVNCGEELTAALAKNKVNKNRRVISEQTAKIIKNLMVDTVATGTANNISSDIGITIAGKTGSAEAAFNGIETVHGWFTGFMPAENPKYVITVFVESGGSGRGSAVPLFQQIAMYLKSN